MLVLIRIVDSGLSLNTVITEISEHLVEPVRPPND
jgi:hypothetical protein